MLKNRNGETGEVKLGWDGPHLRFVDPASDPRFSGGEKKALTGIGWAEKIEMEDIDI